MKTIRLKPGKERAALRGHPWIFEGAIAGGGADQGETVRVESAQGAFTGWGSFSPSSQIRVRLWSFHEAERIDEAFFVRRLHQSVQARRSFDVQSNAVRLVHAEADGLPGLIVDRYQDVLVTQFLSAGVERFKPFIVKTLAQLEGVTRIYDRSEASVRALEGLQPATGWLHQASSASASTDVVIREHEWQLALNIAEGHKTGFYLDQRDNRKLFSEYARRLGFKRVLNCYCYTGGFTVAALKGMQSAAGWCAEGFEALSEHLDSSAQLPNLLSNHSNTGLNVETDQRTEDKRIEDKCANEQSPFVLSIDSSAPALSKAREQLRLNGLEAPYVQFKDADVNASLRQMLEAGERFDAVVLDPPKFAPTAAHAERAARAYKDINRLALKLLRPGGVLFTFSCSGGISADLFHKIVASAGADAGVDGFILQRLGAAPDHPMTINFPEGEYLKGLVVLKK